MINFREIKHLDELADLKVGEVIKIGQIFKNYEIIPALCDSHDGQRITLLMTKSDGSIVEYSSLSIVGYENEGIEGIYPNGSLRMNFHKNLKEIFREGGKGYSERKIKLEKVGLL
ncbi:MAG: hypothetical protein AABW81_02145 [Nanoarchaeota archaeon]|mgnify:FL=1